uniref:Uncharacterized protein n=1 Tax=Anguilla anguilla TaxID=7936 RepID=A0A0E9UDM8_ANGAN
MCLILCMMDFFVLSVPSSLLQQTHCQSSHCLVTSKSW